MQTVLIPCRYHIPLAQSFQAAVQDDIFDIETARDDEAKDLATNARASKLWRTLRIASRTSGMLRRFDKIDDGNHLQALFEETKEGASSKGTDDGREPSQTVLPAASNANTGIPDNDGGRESEAPKELAES